MLRSVRYVIYFCHWLPFLCCVKLTKNPLSNWSIFSRFTLILLLLFFLLQSKNGVTTMTSVAKDTKLVTADSAGLLLS